MKIHIQVPSPGESIHEVTVARWLVENGSYVEKDTEIAELESDKATLTLNAEQSGIIEILIPQGKTVEVGTIACTIDTDAHQQTKKQDQKINKTTTSKESNVHNTTKVTPLAQKMIDEMGLNTNTLKNEYSNRITTEVVKNYIHSTETKQLNYERTEKRIELSPLRKKLSERLMQAKNSTAMLTTFNEIDMSALIDIRSKYKEIFTQKHGVKLGFMSFFAKATTIALKEYPIVNSRLDGHQLIYFDYIDLGIAAQTEKGLVVPVVRNAESKSLSQLEREIFELAEKARNKKISIAELEGGTFSITNGGVFGSLLATPLLNYPQTAILGMHAIQNRPIALNNQIEIRPMMYIALSYDHRILDGKDSILFLKRIKELIENPILMYNNLTLEKFLDL